MLIRLYNCDILKNTVKKCDKGKRNEKYITHVSVRYTHTDTKFYNIEHIKKVYYVLICYKD